MDRDRRGGAAATGRAPRRLAGAVAGGVLAAVLLVGCGAGAVDRGDEVRALVATCRSIQERTTGRPAAPVDAAAIEALLAAEPGAPGDRSVASLVRRVCTAATRDAADGSRRGSWLPLPLPDRPGR